MRGMRGESLIIVLAGIVSCTRAYRIPYRPNIDEMQVVLNGIDSSLADKSISKDCIFSVSETRGESRATKRDTRRSEEDRVWWS